LLRGSPTQICWRSLRSARAPLFWQRRMGSCAPRKARHRFSVFRYSFTCGSTSDFPLVGHVSTEECMFCCLQNTTQQTIPPWAQCGATNRQGLFTLSSFWEIQPFVTLTCALLCSSLGQKKLGDCMPTSSTRSTRSLSYGPPWAHYLGGYQD
jgi:hypothetical protein